MRLRVLWLRRKSFRHDRRRERKSWRLARPRPPLPALCLADGFPRLGPTLAAQAFRAGLVDLCHRFIAPIIVGDGNRAFPNDLRLDLALGERRFRNGRLTYTPDHQPIDRPPKPAAFWPDLWLAGAVPMGGAAEFHFLISLWLVGTSYPSAKDRFFSKGRTGAPEGTRTPNPRFRRPMLCPVELQARLTQE
jgi:RibD C-terminal domain